MSFMSMTVDDWIGMIGKMKAEMTLMRNLSEHETEWKDIHRSEESKRLEK